MESDFKIICFLFFCKVEKILKIILSTHKGQKEKSVFCLVLK